MDRRYFLKYLTTLPLIIFNLKDYNFPKKSENVTLLETQLAGFQYYGGENVWKKIKT